MNTWGYLILIGAIIVVAAIMLYARFSSRSREKSLHHSPLAFEHEEEAEVLHVDEAAPDPENADTEEVEANPIEEEDHEHEEKYIDDLQEAAAGLAALMRSSPVADRTSPVVFSPEETGEEIEPAKSSEEPEAEDEVPVPEADSETMEVDSPEEAEAENVPGEVEFADDSEVAPVGETGGVEFIEEERVEEPAALSAVVSLLGEKVSGQIGRIDEGLDALEDLVSGIEQCLAALGDGDIETATLEETRGEMVGEAA